jgi:hypothetical protein
MFHQPTSSPHKIRMFGFLSAIIFSSFWFELVVSGR